MIKPNVDSTDKCLVILFLRGRSLFTIYVYSGAIDELK